MDGKHIAIRCPLKSGSNYYNYKQFYRIVLLALVDADYKFKYIDCGCNGRVSDGGVFANSTLFQTLESNTFHIPPVTAEKYTCAICHCWGWSISIKILFDETIPIPKFGPKQEDFYLPTFKSKENTGKCVWHFNLQIWGIQTSYTSRTRKSWKNSFGMLCIA